MKIYASKFRQLYKDLQTLDLVLVPVPVPAVEEDIIQDKICLLVAIQHGIPITIILKVIKLLFVVVIEIQELDEILDEEINGIEDDEEEILMLKYASKLPPPPKKIKVLLFKK